jgi:hypothetical protein
VKKSSSKHFRDPAASVSHISTNWDGRRVAGVGADRVADCDSVPFVAVLPAELLLLLIRSVPK